MLMIGSAVKFLPLIRYGDRNALPDDNSVWLRRGHRGYGGCVFDVRLCLFCGLLRGLLWP